jgi:hypothetical protein
MVNFPGKIVRMAYSVEDRELHDYLRRVRNEVYAHSDGASYMVEPWKGAQFETIMRSLPQMLLTPEQASRLVAMTSVLLDHMYDRMDELAAAAGFTVKLSRY